MQSSRAHYGVLCRAAKSKQQLDLFAAGGWRERGLIVPSADRSRSTRRSWVVWFWLCTQDAFPCPWLPHSRIDLPVSVGVQALGVPYAALSLYRDTGSLLGLWHARRRPRRTTHAWFWQRLGAARRYGHVLLACNTCSWTWWGVTRGTTRCSKPTFVIQTRPALVSAAPRWRCGFFGAMGGSRRPRTAPTSSVSSIAAAFAQIRAASRCIAATVAVWDSLRRWSRPRARCEGRVRGGNPLRRALAELLGKVDAADLWRLPLVPPPLRPQCNSLLQLLIRKRVRARLQ